MTEARGGSSGRRGPGAAAGHGGRRITSASLVSSPAGRAGVREHHGRAEAASAQLGFRLGVWRRVCLMEILALAPGGSRALPSCPLRPPGGLPAPLWSPLKSLLEMTAFDGWGTTALTSYLQKR